MARITNVKTKSEINANLELTSHSASGQALYPTQLNPSEITYTTSSTPPVQIYDDTEITLAGTGAQTSDIDLTDLTDLEGSAQDATGYKLQELRVQCPATNSAAITVGNSGSNDYEPFGSSNEVEVVPGGLLHCRFDDELSDVSGSVKIIRISGTGGDVAEVELLLG